MKIVTIMGSHRRQGYSRQILDHCLAALGDGHELTAIDVNTIKIKHCLACDYCLEHQGKCILQDDMTDIYARLMAAELILVAAPVYFSAFPAKFKMLLDRCQMIYNLQDSSGIPPKDIAYFGIGGARPYAHQFLGCFYTLEWWLKDLNAQLIGSVTASETDRISPLEDEKSRREIDDLVTAIKNKINNQEDHNG